MRSIISTILIIFILIAVAVEAKGGRRELSRTKLSQLIEDIERIKKNNFGDDDEDNKKVSKSFDMECVKNFFKFPQNHKMMIYDAEEMIFIIGAALKCSDEEKTFETIYKKYIHNLWKERLSCIKWHLQQLEPTSKLIENFVISDDELKECKEFPIYEELSDLLEKIEFHFGPLNVYSCGAVSDDGAKDFVKFLGKGAVIRYGNISEELQKSEKEKLREYFRDLAISTVNCVIKRFEDNPQAYLVNDTLNYYFIKQSIPTDPKETENDRYDYYKRLIKLEGVVDNDCIKEKLNLPKNGNLSLLKDEAIIIIASVRSKCIRVSVEEYFELFMNFALWSIDRTEDLYSCSRYKLHKIEPTSKLVRNYVKDEKIEELCDSYNDHTYVYQIPMYSYYDYGGKLNETSCGVMSDEIVNVIKLKSILVFDEKDKDVRVSEAKNLFNYATDIFHKFADCILERIRGE